MKRNRWLLMMTLSLVAALALIACARAFGQSRPVESAPGFSVVADDERPLDLTAILGVDITALERPQIIVPSSLSKLYPADKALAKDIGAGFDAVEVAYDDGAACAPVAY